MENSTKAFYMAAGVLIGILIITAFAFVFSKGGQLLSTIDNKEISRQVEEYNSKLIIYNRTGIEENYNTIFDVITACNLAYDINNQNMFDNKNYLEIELKVDEQTYTLENSESQKKGCIGETKLTDLIKDYGKTIEETFEYEYKFKGEVQYDEQTGKINKIIFDNDF